MTNPPGTYTLQETAKMIGIGSNCLFKKLREAKVLDNNNYPYQRHINAGYFTVHRGHFNLPTNGMLKYYARPLTTNKGIEWLARLIEKEQAA